jgi:DNA polymerase III subunit delta'
VAADVEDPRETPLHPRHAESVIGHDEILQRFVASVAQGKPHHAWLLTGPRGIGKTTLAYALARRLLAGTMADKLITARSHPDLFVLQRQADPKTGKLKTEISVEDARALSAFFERTAAMAPWRVAIIDCADDLNTESANALLKLMEEPPPKSILLLASHQPGRLLRTIRSRCMRVDLSPLSEPSMKAVFGQKRFEDMADGEDFTRVLPMAQGSPGRAIALVASPARKALECLHTADIRRPEGRLEVMNSFSGRALSSDDFELFVDLLLDWIASRAKSQELAISSRLAESYSQIQSLARRADAFNLDRKLTIFESLVLLDRALKAA